MNRSKLDKEHYGFYKDRPVYDNFFLVACGIFVATFLRDYSQSHYLFTEGIKTWLIYLFILSFLALYRFFLHRRFFPLKPLIRIDHRGITIFTKERSQLIPFENSAMVLIGVQQFFRAGFCTVKVIYHDGKMIDTTLPADLQELDRVQKAVEIFRRKTVPEETTKI